MDKPFKWLKDNLAMLDDYWKFRMCMYSNKENRMETKKG